MPEKLSSEQKKVIGRIIRDARVDQGLAQIDIERLARAKGWRIAQPTISAIENGRSALSNLQALVLMAILGCRDVIRYRTNPRFLEDWQGPATRAFEEEFVASFPEKLEGLLLSINEWFRQVCCAALERLQRERPELFKEDWRHRTRGPRWPAPTEPV